MEGGTLKLTQGGIREVLLFENKIYFYLPGRLDRDISSKLEFNTAQLDFEKNKS